MTVPIRQEGSKGKSMSNDSTARVSIQPTEIMGRLVDALGLKVPRPGWSHTIGDHRFCGHACLDKGKDLRPGLGIYESVIADGRPDPATIDERITHQSVKDSIIDAIIDGVPHTRVIEEPDPGVPDAAWTKDMLVNYLHEVEGRSKGYYSRQSKTALVGLAQVAYDKYDKTAAHKKETAK